MCQRVNKLEEMIRSAKNSYYYGDPEMPDDQYDSLVDELARLDQTNPLLGLVGGPIPETTPFQKVEHRIPMGSLSKCNTVEEYKKWFNKAAVANDANIIVQDKLDGFSVEVVYKDGVFCQAITRGDGLIGEDITHSIGKIGETFSEVLYVGDRLFSGSLRGECLFSKAIFDKYLSKEYANARNAIAGVMRSLDSQFAKNAIILFFDCINENQEFETETQKISFMQRLGIPVVRSIVISNFLQPVDKSVAYLLEDVYLKRVKERANYAFEADGLVIKVDNISKQKELGEVNGTPKGQVAWKFPPELGQTKVIEITWELGKTGRITPVAHLEPVRVCGVTISKATLHNAKRVHDLGIGVGAVVSVSRRGDVIPAVESVIVPGASTEVPEACPECSGLVQFEGEYLVCTNQVCPGKAFGNVMKWLEVLDIQEVGPAFVEASKISDPSDLYILTEQDIIGIPGYQEVSAKKIVRSIRSKMELTLPIFLAALNIPGCSTATFEALERNGLDTLDKMLNSSIDELVGVIGVGRITAKAVVDGLKKKKSLIDNLLMNGVKIMKRKTGKLLGQSFCFTGEICIKRGLAQKLVRDLGGEVKSSVSKGLTFLVQADPNSESGKSKKAIQYGTKVMGEDEFLELVEFYPEKLV